MVNKKKKNYTYGIDRADIRFVNDLLLIFLISHLGSIGLFAMRVLGLDYNKFRFNIRHSIPNTFHIYTCMI